MLRCFPAIFLYRLVDVKVPSVQTRDLFPQNFHSYKDTDRYCVQVVYTVWIVQDFKKYIVYFLMFNHGKDIQLPAQSHNPRFL